MSEQLRESLSAAMDGEADAFELRRVLDEAKHDDQLREEWHRLHLIRDFMRQEVHIFQPDLREAIWEELNQPLEDDEAEAGLVLASASLAGKRGRSPWFGRLTGTGVALAVAILVMFNGGVFESPQNPVDYAGATQAGVNTDLIPVMYPQAKPVDRQRQNGLMLLHYQQQAMNRPGVTSFVKVATFRSAPKMTPALKSEQTSIEAASRP